MQAALRRLRQPRRAYAGRASSAAASTRAQNQASAGLHRPVAVTDRCSACMSQLQTESSWGGWSGSGSRAAAARCRHMRAAAPLAAVPSVAASRPPASWVGTSPRDEPHLVLHRLGAVDGEGQGLLALLGASGRLLDPYLHHRGVWCSCRAATRPDSGDAVALAAPTRAPGGGCRSQGIQAQCRAVCQRASPSSCPWPEMAQSCSGMPPAAAKGARLPTCLADQGGKRPVAAQARGFAGTPWGQGGSGPEVARLLGKSPHVGWRWCNWSPRCNCVQEA